MNPDVIVIDTNPYKDEKQKVKILPLVPETHPALRMKLKEFDFRNPSIDPDFLASSLVETCKSHNGLGLSANQCGYEYRVFVAGHGDNFVSFFNPKVIWKSEGQIKIEEGCLSFKHLFLTIERPHSVEIEYQDFTGKLHQAKFSGLTARCILHELDHLDGILYTSKVRPMTLLVGMKKRYKALSLEKKNASKLA